MRLKCILLRRLGIREATLLILVSSGVGALAAAATPTTEANALTADALVPKSVFIDDPRSSRDPFFPNSTRRNPRPTPPRPTPSTPVPPQPIQLTLRAILVGQNKRLAQINNRNFEAGEEAEVLVGNQKIKVRCLEIRESSVLVSIEGGNEPKELSLRQR
jgi:hypothetical protein